MNVDRSGVEVVMPPSTPRVWMQYSIECKWKLMLPQSAPRLSPLSPCAKKLRLPLPATCGPLPPVCRPRWPLRAELLTFRPTPHSVSIRASSSSSSFIKHSHTSSQSTCLLLLDPHSPSSSSSYLLPTNDGLPFRLAPAQPEQQGAPPAEVSSTDQTLLVHKDRAVEQGQTDRPPGGHGHQTIRTLR